MGHHSFHLLIALLLFCSEIFLKKNASCTVEVVFILSMLLHLLKVNEFLQAIVWKYFPAFNGGCVQQDMVDKDIGLADCFKAGGNAALALELFVVFQFVKFNQFN